MKPHRPTCSNFPCPRRATHTVQAFNMVALMCPVCAGQAKVDEPRLKLASLDRFNR